MQGKNQSRMINVKRNKKGIIFKSVVYEFCLKKNTKITIMIYIFGLIF